MTVIDRGAFRPGGFPLASWTYAIRIWIAAVVALYLSFWLELEAPSSAILTVAIIAEPTRGQAREKGAYRLVATVIGVAASIIITGIFSQTRDLLLIAFAIWLGLCVYVSGLLDGNRAYAAVLSGSTVAFIAAAQIDNPGHVFESSMARGAAIVIGVLSVTIINDLLSAPDRYPRLAAQLDEIHRRIRECAKQTIFGEIIKPVTYASLIAEIVALRPEIASLTVESSSGPARGASAQNAATALVAELHALRALGALPPIAEATTRENILRVLEAADDHGLSATQAAGHLVVQGDTNGMVATSTWIFRELMLRDQQVRENLAALRGDRRPPWRWRTLRYRSHLTSAESGVRAAIWFGLAEAFLAYGGWSAASASLFLVAVVIGLGDVAPNPLVPTALALVAAPIACALAGIIEFVVLDGVSDFPLLAIALAPLVVGAALMMTSKTRAVSALGRLSLIFAVSIFAPTNPPTYNAQSYLYSSLFVCIAIALLLCAQLLVPPVSGLRRQRRLLDSAQSELAQAPILNRRHRPEEEMFRDATRIGDIIIAGGGVTSNAGTVEEALSHFDQTSAIRLSIAKLKAIADGPSDTEVRAALISRDPLALLNVARTLRAASADNYALGDLCATLVVLSRFIEAAQARPQNIRAAG